MGEVLSILVGSLLGAIIVFWIGSSAWFYRAAEWIFDRMDRHRKF